MESSFSSQGDRPMSRALATAFLGVPTSMGIVNMGQTTRKQLEAQAVLLARVTASARNTVSFHFPSFGQTFPFSHSVGVFSPLKTREKEQKVLTVREEAPIQDYTTCKSPDPARVWTEQEQLWADVSSSPRSADFLGSQGMGSSTPSGPSPS